MNDCKAFGIDLGTTNTLACFYRNGKFEMLTSNFTEEKYPSVVAFPSNSSSFIIGKNAKETAKSRPKDVIYDVKRLIGIDYDSEIVRTMQKNCSFTIKDDGNNKPVIAYKQNGVEYTKYPHEISAIVLSQIAHDMKERTGFDIKDVVITVPAYFSQHQRKLTEDAARIAGLNVLEIITEPQATILAATDNYQDDKERTVFLYDFGGGTFDVSILRVCGMEFEVLALDGDLFLGGNDIDTIIMNAFIFVYEEEKGIEFPERQKLLLRWEVEKAKKLLMSDECSQIACCNFEWNLTREFLNSLIATIIDSTFVVCQRALNTAHLTVQDIDEVYAVGNSSRLQLVQEKVREFFRRDEITGTLNQGEAIAVGAARYANYLLTHPKKTSCIGDSMIVEEVAETTIPLFPINPPILTPPIQFKTKAYSDIGVILPSGRFKPIIKKNQRLPCNENYSVTNIRDNMTEITIPIIQRTIYQNYNAEKKVYENIIRYTKNSEIKITDVTPMSKGENNILMFVDMNEHGSMSIEIEDLDTGNEMQFTDILTATTEEEINSKREELNNQMQKNIENNQMNNLKNELLNRCSIVMNKNPTAINQLVNDVRKCQSITELRKIEKRLSQFE